MVVVEVALWLLDAEVTDQDCANCMKPQALVKTDVSYNAHINPNGQDGLIYPIQVGIMLQ